MADVHVGIDYLKEKLENALKGIEKIEKAENLGTGVVIQVPLNEDVFSILEALEFTKCTERDDGGWDLGDLLVIMPKEWKADNPFTTARKERD